MRERGFRGVFLRGALSGAALACAVAACVVVAGTDQLRAEGGLAPATSLVPRPLAWAYEAVRQDDWSRAAQIAERDGPVAVGLIEWMRLREGRGSAPEVMAFLATHPDWPGLPLLRVKAEPTFSNAPPQMIIDFFAGQAPRTAIGALALSRAYAKQGRQDEADAALIAGWREMPMSAEEQLAYVAVGADVLRPHHGERMEEMFWDGEQGNIDRMKALVSPADWALAEARRRARRGDDGGIAALTPAQKADPALAYARYRAAQEARRTDDAKDLMIAQSRAETGLGHPAAWANQRRIYAREEMRRGNPQRAYEIATHHGLTPGDGGAHYADLEWLAGFIALRQLDRPEDALWHFQAMAGAVQTPISLGRAYYWIGRAYDAMGKPDMAQASYREGGQFQTSYYGLLAAEKAGMAIDPALSGAGAPPDWRVPELMNSQLLEASDLLLSAGHPYWSEMFMTQLADGQDNATKALIGAMYEARKDPHLQVRLGKHLAGEGIVLPRYYYALHPLSGLDLAVKPELALAIARRESEFDSTVVSPAGAGGLMQLMPGTARDMAAKLGITDHDQGRLFSDWHHNARLGSAYLAKLADEFEGNPVLMSAGYNAGPRRAAEWINLYGDPRDPGVDIVDWVEFIPYRETRNYVQRVTESLPIYRARLGEQALPVPFSQELKGSGLRALPLSPEGK